jgi:hypothetical protein
MPKKDRQSCSFVGSRSDFFFSLQGWLELDAAVKSGPVTGFGMKLSAIVDFYLSE